MSIIIRTKEQTFIKRNRIEPTKEFSISFWDFVKDPQYTEIKTLFSVENYYKPISFAIQRIIADMDHDHKTNIPHNLQLLLKNDFLEIYSFSDMNIVPKHLQDTPLSKPLYDEDTFDILTSLKYKFSHPAVPHEFDLQTYDTYFRITQLDKKMRENVDTVSYGQTIEKNEILSYILFMFFVSDEKLFIVADKYALIFTLTNEVNLHEYLGEYNYIFSLREAIAGYFSAKDLEQFAFIRQQYAKQWNELDIMKHIQECCDIHQAFKNGHFAGKIDNGKPVFLEVLGHTTDKDPQKISKDLWAWASVRSKYDWNGSIAGLEIGKTFKKK